jgi:hypothetical protein
MADQMELEEDAAGVSSANIVSNADKKRFEVKKVNYIFLYTSIELNFISLFYF